MNYIGLTGIVFATVITGGTYLNGAWNEWRCDHLIEDGDGKAALRVSDKLRTAPFVPTAVAKACADRATLAAARQAIDKGFFQEAARHLSKIRDVADGSLRAEAQALAARLPEMHLAWVEQKIDKGEIELAITELVAMRKLYLKQTEVLLRVKSLEALARIQKGELDLKKGPIEAVIVSLRELDKDIPLALRARADQLVEAAIEAGAKDQTDLPGVMRWLARVKKQVAHLGSTLVDRVSEKVLKDRGLAPQVNLIDAVPPPPIVILESKSASNESKLRIDNKTDKALQIQLIKDTANLRLEIAPRSMREIALAPGEYTQTVMSSGSRDQSGVIQLDGNVYGQTFTR